MADFRAVVQALAVSQLLFLQIHHIQSVACKTPETKWA